MAKIPKIIEPIDADFDDLAQKMMSNKGPKVKSKTQVRLHEADLYIPTLRIANSSLGGFVSTSDLIQKLETIFNIAGDNAEILEGRSDTKFSQIVRNMISHRTATTNFIARGFAEYDKERKGIQITVKGRRLLSTIYE